MLDITEGVLAEFADRAARGVSALELGGYSVDSIDATGGGHGARAVALARARADSLAGRVCVCGAAVPMARAKGGPVPRYCGRKCSKNAARNAIRRAHA